jgi:bacterioferritin (cytochrome b1)
MRYLARLILDDEQRHQMIFGDLAETVFATDDLKARGMPILQGSHVSDDAVRQRTVTMLETLITREDDERLELAALRSTLAPSKESELWNVLLALVAHDTERHISWLEFMRDRML